MSEAKTTVRLTDTTTSFPVEPVDLNQELSLEERYERYRTLLNQEKAETSAGDDSKSRK